MSNRKLLTREKMFIVEYLLDHDAAAAACRAGYPSGIWGERVLKKIAVRRAIAEEEEKHRARLAVTPENIMVEWSRIAFANARDYWPGKGKELDLQRLDIDRTAAVAEFQVEEQEDPRTGQIYRRTRVKLHDKLAALRDLARATGLLREETTLTIEHRIKQMTPGERLQMAQELLERGRQYLPAYEAAEARGEVIEAPVEEDEEGAAQAPPPEKQ